MTLILLTIAILIFNIPFGFWRAQVKKFSVQWFLAIHLPVPFIILARLYFEVGFAFYTYVLFVGAFFIGQRIGVILFRNESFRKKIIAKEQYSAAE